MKGSKSSKLSRVGIFTLQLTIVPLTLVILAQTNPQPEKPTLESAGVQQTEVERNSNLVWLGGLLGLVSLASLVSLAVLDSRKHLDNKNNEKHETPVHYRETEEENYWG